MPKSEPRWRSCWKADQHKNHFTESHSSNDYFLQFGSHWPIDFWREDEKRKNGWSWKSAVGPMFCMGSTPKSHILIGLTQWQSLPSFVNISPVVFEKKLLRYKPNTINNDTRKLMTKAHMAQWTRWGKQNANMLTGTNSFRNSMLTTQWETVSLWRSLMICLTQWDID